MQEKKSICKGIGKFEEKRWKGTWKKKSFQKLNTKESKTHSHQEPSDGERWKSYLKKVSISEKEKLTHEKRWETAIKDAIKKVDKWKSVNSRANNLVELVHSINNQQIQIFLEIYIEKKESQVVGR